MFDAKIIKDSITEFGDRLTTMEWTYPRFIHSEIMTHRDRARNAASSRAIPWPKMMERITENPVVPIHFGMEQRGMQSGEALPPELQEFAEQLWLEACDSAVYYADALHNIGRFYANNTGDEQFKDIKIHKSLPNRITEPWMWITVIMTTTNWQNLWRLRCHEDAEVHFQKIAGMARDAMKASEPTLLEHGDWHMPYVTDKEIKDHSATNNHRDWCAGTGEWFDWRQVSTARCARVSYLTHDGRRDIQKDIELFERLVTGSGFGHWSPHEHVATPGTSECKSGPYIGWLQYRKFFQNECAKDRTP